MRTARKAKLWAVIAAAVVAVAACSNNASPSASGAAGSAPAASVQSAAPAEKVTVNFPYLWSGPEGAALEKVISAYNASQNGITVKGVSSPDFQKQLASMSGSNGFDISDNFGSTVGSWASKGILEPLDDYMKADGFDTTAFVPTALQSNQYQGKTYALPIAVHTLLLMYNKKLFADAGIANPPMTTRIQMTKRIGTNWLGSGGWRLIWNTECPAASFAKKLLVLRKLRNMAAAPTAGRIPKIRSVGPEGLLNAFSPT